MKIDNVVLKFIQKQISIENGNHLVYVELANWCAFNGYENAAELFMKQANDELAHRDRFRQFLLDMGYMPAEFVLSKFEYDAIKELEDTVFAALAVEQNTTKEIIAIKEAANNADDYVSSEMLNWFLAEQREEESLFIGLIDVISSLKLLDASAPDWFKGSLRLKLNEHMKAKD